MSAHPRPPTLKQVAAMVGLSTAAVSLILNGKGNFRPETRRRVADAARGMGYRPNGFAQAIAQGRFGTFALLMASESRRSRISGSLLDGIEDGLETGDEHLVVARLPDERLSDAGFVPKLLSRFLADGLIIDMQFAIPERMQELIAAAGVPAIWLNRKLEHDAVFADDHGDAAIATRHLLGLGHRRIAWLDFNVGPGEDAWHYSNADRRDGYVVAMREAGLAPRILGSPAGHLRYADRVPACRAILADPDRPTALLVYNSDAAVPMLIAAAAAGVRVPDDLSLIVFNDGTANATGQDLSVMSIPTHAIGRQAVMLLRDRLREGRPVPACAVPGTLLRMKTDAPPG